MAKTKAETVQLELTPEEIQAVLQAREHGASGPSSGANVAIGDLAAALITAINATKTPEKKTPFTRKKGGPWVPKDGKPKPKLRRNMLHHGLDLSETNLSSEEIELLNKVKPGSFCGGFVKVIKRKDRSLDIDYPIKTASQRLKLVNSFGVRSFVELLQRIIEEAARPAQFKTDEDDD